MVRAIEDFDMPNPFGELGAPVSDLELRETAYEILIGACRSSASKKPLTFISQSEKLAASADKSSSSASLLSSTNSSGSLQRSLTSAAASKVKKALGLKKTSSKASEVGEEERNKPRRTGTVGELIRVQMRVSEHTDSRVRRALLRIAAGQLGRRMESIVLPLEFLQQFKPSDFPDQQDYESWQRRNLKILELGLLLHPQIPVSRSDASAQKLRQIIRGAREKPIETGKNSEAVQVLRTAVTSLAYRSLDGTACQDCHWADGFPLNLHLYQMLLEACFDVNDQTSVIDDIDELLELIKKTWVILGIDQMLHNLCFSWVLFHRYVETGQLENDLLFAASNLLTEIERDKVATSNPESVKVLTSTLSTMLDWAEKRLVTYHDSFNSGNSDVMQSVVSIAVTSAKLMAEDLSRDHRKLQIEVDVARDRVDSYIRSSVRYAFAQKMEKVNLIKRSSKNQRDSIPVLCILAQEVTELAFNENEIYSPILKTWHPHAAGAAVATLHGCYGNELKQFISGISELTPDAVQVLISADKLEKQLVQIAVDDAVESEDGGIEIIKKMPPYEAESLIATLVKSWITTRVDTMKQWVDRCLQQEVWKLQANKEQVAPSAIEVLRTIDEYLEAFFLLPIPIEAELVTDLVAGLDRCLQQYILKANSGCGSRDSYIPSFPALTRCSVGSKFFKKKDKSQTATRRGSQVGSTNGHDLFGIPQLCIRINTVHHLRSGAGYLEKKTITYMKKSGSTEVDDLIMNGHGVKFELCAAVSSEAIQQLCEVTAYKIVFHELGHVLWDGLYAGEASSSRIEPFLLELDRYLGIIATSVHDRVRTRVITEVMKASFDGFLTVLLAGGPSRAFGRQDHAIVEEDFKLLCDLFWSNGDGLPTEVIDRCSSKVKSILPLLGQDTETLIEQFRQAIFDTYGQSTKSRLPMPPTTGEWGPNDPNTLLRVLCHRSDEVASKFLKKTYSLPKKL